MDSKRGTWGPAVKDDAPAVAILTSGGDAPGEWVGCVVGRIEVVVVVEVEVVVVVVVVVLEIVTW